MENRRSFQVEVADCSEKREVKQNKGFTGLLTTKSLANSRQKKKLFFGTCATTFVAIVSVLFTSCLSRDPEATNQLLINNTTEDTIVFSEYRYKHSKEDSIYMDLVGEEEYRIQFHNCCIVLPNECYFLGGTTIPAMDIIRRNYQDLSREIKIYKLACDASDGLKMIECNSRDTLYVEKQHRVSWLPPLQYLSDSVHSFYNIKSWVIKKGGKKNKWERATFTITEDDLK